jgi:hypothetical protein
VTYSIIEEASSYSMEKIFVFVVFNENNTITVAAAAAAADDIV